MSGSGFARGRRRGTVLRCIRAACGAWLLGLAPLAGVHAQGLPPLTGSVQLAGGEFHTCSLGSNGGVKCWGSNRFGQLGAFDPSTAQRETPVDVTGLASGVRAIAAGQLHTCAVLQSGAVRCWGRNNFGQLGDGTQTDRPRAVDVTGLGEAAIAVAAGEEHTCAVLASGRIRCWGRNDFSQLGNDRNVSSPTPVDVSGIASGATQVAAGRYHTCAVHNGAAVCWGSNDAGQLGDGTTARRRVPVPVTGLTANVREVAAGRSHACALTHAGAMSCWGLNSTGQLGDGGTATRSVPATVAGLGQGVRAIAANLSHTCAVLDPGAVRCWGENFFGQVGDESFLQRNQPTPVATLEAGAERIAAGYRHNCVTLAGSGQVRCWGNNFDGQLGDDTFTGRLVPYAVSGLGSGVERIGTGFQHGCAFGAAIGSRCWGDNASGQLGNGSTVPSTSPVTVSGLAPTPRQMSGGTFHSCSLSSGGGVKCWGANGSGQLGDGTLATRLTPVDVAGLSSGAISVATGAFHSCAVVANGEVRCWGSNSNGQLGPGGGSGATEPQPVGGLGSVAAVSAGAAHTCALTTGGAVKCWGANESGQLGNLGTQASAEPVDVAGLGAGVIAIASGGSQAAGSFNCALLATGAVQCWGANVYGQLGDGTTTNRSGPVDVRNLGGGVRSIDVSAFHACAVNVVGALFCWGRNIEGQLGINSTEQKNSPVAVSGLGAAVADVSAGGGQTCARIDPGAVRCWGANNFGQVGDGTSWGRRRPVTVVLNEPARDVVALTPAADAESRAAVSDDSGRYVVFQSRAANLVPGDTNGASDVFRLDRERNEIVRVSSGSGGQAIGGDSIEPSVSGDGRWVVFVAPEGSVAGTAPAGAQEPRKASGFAIYLRDIVVGTTQRLGPAQPGGTGSVPQIGANATRVVWTAPNPPGTGTPGQENIYSVTLAPAGNGLQPGAPQCLTCFVLDGAGQPTATPSNGASRNPGVSADGSVVVWETTASNTGENGPLPKTTPCPAPGSTVWLRNLVAAQATSRVSVPAPGGSCGSAGQSATRPHVDGSGDRVVFESTQPLVSGDTNGQADVFVWTRATRTVDILSTGAGDVSGLGASTQPRISRDGSTVAFVSAAPNLDVSFADNNNVADVHVVPSDGASPPLRLSRSSSGGEATQASDRPALNASGTKISFDSLAPNLSLTLGNVLSQVVQRSNPAKAGTPLKSATWWNPQESGWGLFVFDQGSAMAPAWFTYDVDGEPMWLIGAALPQPDGSHRGELFRFTGRPFNQAAGLANESTQSVGSVTLRHGGTTSLQFDYTVNGVSQSKALVPFGYAGRKLACRASESPSRAAATNYSDVWWGGSANSGWGLFVTHLDDNLYALWYTYDADREPVFFTAVTSRQADGSFSGPLLRQQNGTPLLQISGQRASPGASQVGGATFRFADGERGTFAWTMGANSDSRTISRYQYGSTPAICEAVDAN